MDVIWRHEWTPENISRHAGLVRITTEATHLSDALIGFGVVVKEFGAYVKPG